VKYLFKFCRKTWS